MVRWPVGGIRSFLRYVYAGAEFRDCDLDIISPSAALEQEVASYLVSHRSRFEQADLRAAPALAMLWERVKSADLVHSHGFTSGLLAAFPARLRGRPHLMTAHDVLLPSQFRGLRGTLKRGACAQAFRRLDCVHTVTHDATENFLTFFPEVPRDRVQPIIHGIDTTGFAHVPPRDYRRELDLPEDALLVGFLGRFMAQKGFRDLVRAMKILRNEAMLERPVFVITHGDGGFAREDYAYVEREGLGPVFRQLPRTDDIGGAIKGMDVVAMPSRWEACGLLAMEVLCAGAPLVGTTCIGLREVLEGTPAEAVPPEQPRALAEALARALEPARREAFSEYAPQAAVRYGIERPRRELRALYDRLAAVPD